MGLEMDRMTVKRFVVEKYSVRDMSIDEKYVNSSYHIGDEGIAQSLCDLLNELHEDLNHELTVSKALRDVVKELEKENSQLKSDLGRIIEQARKNDEFCRSDIRILENALWCPNSANDIKRLKELRKEFLE